MINLSLICIKLLGRFRDYRWLRLRLNMMPITAGFLEPLGESVPLGIYASWSAYYLFGINSYLWFAGHWLVWIILDYLQLKGVQVNCLSFVSVNDSVSFAILLSCFHGTVRRTILLSN